VLEFEWDENKNKLNRQKMAFGLKKLKPVSMIQVVVSS
jgi:uncharacterized DUF497 family protein